MASPKLSQARELGIEVMVLSLLVVGACGSWMGLVRDGITLWLGRLVAFSVWLLFVHMINWFILSMIKEFYDYCMTWYLFNREFSAMSFAERMKLMSNDRHMRREFKMEPFQRRTILGAFKHAWVKTLRSD